VISVAISIAMVILICHCTAGQPVLSPKNRSNQIDQEI
ncbi:unnamed protein product, partial [Acidithrix sp. C25]